MMTDKSESIRVKYGTTPDLTGDDTREVIFHGYGDYIFDNDGLIQYQSEQSIVVTLINLKENTKYYFSITGDFRYNFDYSEQLIENIQLKIDNNSFTTTSGEQSLGYFNATVYPYPTSAQLNISCPESINFAPAFVGYKIEVVYSTTPDFTKAETFSAVAPDYINKDCYIDLEGLTPGTTYYYYIIASFAKEILNDSRYNSSWIIYQNVKMEGADGCGTFTTDSQYY